MLDDYADSIVRSSIRAGTRYRSSTESAADARCCRGSGEAGVSTSPRRSLSACARSGARRQACRSPSSFPFHHYRGIRRRRSRLALRHTSRSAAVSWRRFVCACASQRAPRGPQSCYQRAGVRMALSRLEAFRFSAYLQACTARAEAYFHVLSHSNERSNRAMLVTAPRSVSLLSVARTFNSPQGESVRLADLQPGALSGAVPDLVPR